MVEFLEPRIVSGSDRLPSADMLLVHARRRRLLAVNEGSVLPAAETAEVIVVEEDAIIDEPLGDQVQSSSPPVDHGRPQQARSGLHCYRSLATVSLARLAWSGAIDHAVLHDAIACTPVDAGARAARLILSAATSMLTSAPLGEPSLYVRLGEDDVEVLERALERAGADAGNRLASAALLPEALVGSPTGAAHAASQALASYRGAALVAAWREVMGAPGLPEISRDRDAAAVRLLSTLRALLGEA